jgi:hypothetical protein
MDRVQYNKLIILVVSVLLFASFGGIMIFELFKTPSMSKDEVMISLRDELVLFLDDNIYYYYIQNNGSQDVYVTVQYKEDENTFVVLFYNYLGDVMSRVSRDAITNIFDELLKGNNSHDIKVAGGRLSKGNETLLIEIEGQDVVLRLIERQAIWKAKLDVSIRS